MYDIYGADWCGTCTTVKKYLTARDVPYTFTTLPAGPRGWEIAEELSRSRALPVILKGGVVLPFDEFKAEVGALKRQPRELTPQELDEIEP